MNMGHRMLIRGVFLGSIIFSSVLPASAGFEENFLAFQSVGSLIVKTNNLDNFMPFALVAADIRPGVNSASSVAYSSGNKVNVNASVSDYTFNGTVKAVEGTGAWHAGSYIQDDLSFSVQKSGVYSIDFIFNVNASMELYEDYSKAKLNMTMMSWKGYSYKSLGTKSLLFSGSDDSATFSTSYKFSMKNIEVEAGNQVILPYLIGLWGDVVNAKISWSNVTLADVLIKDQSGTVLAPDSFSLTSESIAFNEVVSPAPVPLPGAAWLLGFGVMGLLGTARRKKK